MKFIFAIVLSIFLAAAVYLSLTREVPAPAEPEAPFAIFEPVAPAIAIPALAPNQEITAKTVEKVTPISEPTPPEPVVSLATPIEPPAVFSPAPVVSPIDEDAIMSAVVRVRCGRTFGSGFILERNGKRYALTAAHVVSDQIDIYKKFQCDIIFPRKDENGNYLEAHYRKGKILLPEETLKNYQEKGIDLAILEVLPLENRAEDAERFPNGYPFVSYEFCPAETLDDAIILWGYAANLGTAITPGAFLSKFEGNIVQYENVSGVVKKSSNEFAGGYVYLPKIEHSLDASIFHHLTVIVSDNNFSGASGGLVFDKNKNCVIGVNIATLVQDNQVFGFVTNSQFGPIKEFIESAL